MSPLFNGRRKENPRATVAPRVETFVRENWQVQITIAVVRKRDRCLTGDASAPSEEISELDGILMLTQSPSRCRTTCRLSSLTHSGKGPT